MTKKYNRLQGHCVNKHIDSSFQLVVLKAMRLGLGNMVRVSKKSPLGLAYCETERGISRFPNRSQRKGTTNETVWIRETLQARKDGIISTLKPMGNGAGETAQYLLSCLVARVGSPENTWQKERPTPRCPLTTTYGLVQTRLTINTDRQTDMNTQQINKQSS